MKGEVCLSGCRIDGLTEPAPGGCVGRGGCPTSGVVVWSLPRADVWGGVAAPGRVVAGGDCPGWGGGGERLPRGRVGGGLQSHLHPARHRPAGSG